MSKAILIRWLFRRRTTHPWWSIVEPCRTRVESVEPCETSGPTALAGILWNPETLIQPYLKPPRTTPQPFQNLVEPCWNGTKHWWNLGAWWNPGGTLVEPWWNPPCTTPAALAEPRETLVKPWWNPGGTLVEPAPDHPAALAEPRGTLVEPWWNHWWNPPRTTPQPLQNLVEPWRNLGGTLVEPWWNLTSGPPRTTPSLSGLRPLSFQLLGEKKTGTDARPSERRCGG